MERGTSFKHQSLQHFCWSSAAIIEGSVLTAAFADVSDAKCTTIKYLSINYRDDDEMGRLDYYKLCGPKFFVLCLPLPLGKENKITQHR